MRAVVQRVKNASVCVEQKICGKIEKGILLLLGIASDDNEKDLEYIVNKVINIRIFPNDQGLMDQSLKQVNGEILIISQFTLYGDARKGRRPSYSEAASGNLATGLYNKAIDLFKNEIQIVQQGVFGAMMDVSLLNWGPVTILLDSGKKF